MWTATPSETKLGIDISQDKPAHAGSIIFDVRADASMSITKSCRDSKLTIEVPDPGAYTVTRTEFDPLRAVTGTVYVHVEAPKPKPKRKSRKKKVTE